LGFFFCRIAEGLCISSDGLKVYVAYEDYDGIPGTKVACYNVGVDIPVWSIDFPGNNEGLVLNEGGTVLMLTQYGGDNSAINIIKAETGDIIMTTPNQNQSLPAISYDGKLLQEVITVVIYIFMSMMRKVKYILRNGMQM